MRLTRVAAATTAALALTLGGGAAPASAFSPYDTGAKSSLRNLVTAMDYYAAFDNDDSYTGVSAAALADWGWSRPGDLDVSITVEDGGAAWHALVQDVRGSDEQTYASAYPVGGVQPGSVQASAPQPRAVPAAAQLRIADLGDGIDTIGLTNALVAANIGVRELCDYSVFVATPNTTNTSLDNDTAACEAAAAVSGASVASVLARMAAVTGGAAAISAIALEFVGDGSAPARVPAWTQQATPTPPKPRTTPATVPEGIWRITPKARQLAAANQVDQATATIALQQCLTLVTATLSGANPYDECTTTPIFLSGQADVPEATNHDIQALGIYPPWVRLNRLIRPSKTSSTWKNSDPICKAKNTTTQDCDEFPFFSTTQGGGTVKPRPNLKAINRQQNQLQGTKLKQFYDVCRVPSNGKFLAIPVPPSARQVPTLAICNP